MVKKNSFNLISSYLLGEYNITVQAIDNKSAGSELSSYTILIDVIPIDDDIKGYLVDINSDGTYDSFEDSDTGKKTNLHLENTTYLIDSDDDKKWNYVYDLVEGFSTYYEYVYEKYYQMDKDSPGFEVMPIFIIIIFLLLIKRRRK